MKHEFKFPITLNFFLLSPEKHVAMQIRLKGIYKCTSGYFLKYFLLDNFLVIVIFKVFFKNYF